MLLSATATKLDAYRKWSAAYIVESELIRWIPWQMAPTHLISLSMRLTNALARKFKLEIMFSWSSSAFDIRFVNAEERRLDWTHRLWSLTIAPRLLEAASIVSEIWITCRDNSWSRLYRSTRNPNVWSLSDEPVSWNSSWPRPCHCSDIHC